MRSTPCFGQVTEKEIYSIGQGKFCHHNVAINIHLLTDDIKEEQVVEHVQ
jgi:hypothetical protein